MYNHERHVKSIVVPHQSKHNYLIMQSSDINPFATSNNNSLQFYSNMSTDPNSTSSSTSSPPLPIIPRLMMSSSLPPLVVLSPCAACKILRRRCADTCMLAPYFPPTDPVKFTTAHRVFGASNIIKLLQDVPEYQRADAVNSMVYEADARIRDPVYGCAGSVCQLQKQVNELKILLARAQADLINVRTQYANLLAFVYMEMAREKQQIGANNSSSLDGFVSNNSLLENSELSSLGDKLI